MGAERKEMKDAFSLMHESFKNAENEFTSATKKAYIDLLNYKVAILKELGVFK